MCEQLCPEDLLKNNIDSLIKHCLKVEQDRKLSVNSIKKLKRYLMKFNKNCRTNTLKGCRKRWCFLIIISNNFNMLRKLTYYWPNLLILLL